MNMKLSEQLKQDHECGDFGKALEGYSERAAALEHVLEYTLKQLSKGSLLAVSAYVREHTEQH